LQARHADGRRRRNPARKAVDSSPAPDSAHKRSPYSACLCLSSFNALRCCCATLLYYLPTRCYWTGDPASVSCTTPKSCLPCIHLYDYLQPAETVPVAVALLPPPSTALFSRLRLDSVTSAALHTHSALRSPLDRGTCLVLIVVVVVPCRLAPSVYSFALSLGVSTGTPPSTLRSQFQADPSIIYIQTAYRHTLVALWPPLPERITPPSVKEPSHVSQRRRPSENIQSWVSPTSSDPPFSSAIILYGFELVLETNIET
jgi:hypothetical protein